MWFKCGMCEILEGLQFADWVECGQCVCVCEFPEALQIVDWAGREKLCEFPEALQIADWVECGQCVCVCVSFLRPCKL